MADNHTHSYNRRKFLIVRWHHLSDRWLIRCDEGRMLAIDDLPDDVLLTVFDFYVYKHQGLQFLVGKDIKRKIETWQSLVHVCRRWRGIVLGSPRRLNLQLYYDVGTSSRETLNIWPALPLLVRGYVSDASVDNVIGVLEHGDQICRIDLDCHKTWQVEKIWISMQAPFLELVEMRLTLGTIHCGDLTMYLPPSNEESSDVPVLPDLFKGRSSTRLRSLDLTAIPYTGLPKLFLCATHLVKISLQGIPHSGYISPHVMATSLSTLTSLEVLHLGFNSSTLPRPQFAKSLFPPCSRDIFVPWDD